MVVGGGPSGMKAASVAARRGHRVTLYERGAQLGGQTLLAQMLPGRAEFGGIVTNLAREMELAGVTVVKGQEVTTEVVREAAPDALVLATGALPRAVAVEGARRPMSSTPGRSFAARPTSATRSSSPTGAATGSASASPRSWRATAAGCA